MKNKLILLLVLLLCFIPTAVAYASYQQTQNAPVDDKTAVKISINDINQKNTTLEKQAEGDEADILIDFFLDLKTRAQKIPALPDSLLGQKCYHVTISNSVQDEEYDFYFSTDPATNYFRAADGSTYKIAEDDARRFITSQYAESLYTEAAMPVMTLSGTYDVTPDEAAWLYINYNGEYVDANTEGQVYNGVESYELDGGLSMAFDVNPDYCMVKVTGAEEEVLYEGTLEDLNAGFRTDTTRQVAVDVHAKWYEDPTRTYSGEIKYRFNSLVTAPAEFWLGMNSVDAGKFVAITVENVTRPEKIGFTSTMVGNPSPVFYPAGNNMAVGLLPVTTDIPTGTYTLSLSYGGAAEDLVLNVNNEGKKVSSVTVDQSLINSFLSDAAVSAFETKAAELMAEGDSSRYFSGSFLEGVTGTLQRGFGRDIYLNGAAEPAFVSNGVDYAAAAGTDVAACNAGKVVFTGSLDHTGNIVVIEHGWGLKTWYYNLGSVDCAVGDMVAKGDKIGTAGHTGFACQTGAHICMSVGSTFVSPYDTWASSSKAAKVLIPLIEN